MPDRPQPVDLLEFVGERGRQYVLSEPAAPAELHELAGDPDRRYVAPVGAGASPRRQRAWLICVLLLALGLPALVVTYGYNRGAEPAEALAAPPTTASLEATTSESEAATLATVKKTTTTVEETTTSSTAAPTTSSTYATTSTTAYATTSSTASAASAAQAAPAPTTTVSVAPTTTTTAYVAPAPPPPASGEAAFLACVRMRESGGNYGAVSPDGLYRGAYQFHQATWNNVASMAGRPDLIGVPANLASPADQDLLAVTLYRAAGPAPWGGSCS